MWHAVAARSRSRHRPGQCPRPARSAAIRSPHAEVRRPAPGRRPHRLADERDAGRRRGRDRHAPRRSDGPQVRPKNGLDRYFEISARRSTVGRELRGGLTTFFTMAYIVVLNPIILSGADVDGNTLPVRRASPRSPR